jgi:hypothetical protein
VPFYSSFWDGGRDEGTEGTAGVCPPTHPEIGGRRRVAG